MRIVVKVGTHTLADGGASLHRPRMIDLVRQIADLHAQGHEVLFVSSGAVFAGREALGARPQGKDIPFKQTLAAIGQVRLMAIYEQLFDFYGIIIAQALLTRADLADRERYLNARNTLLSLLHLRVVPVINENDVVGVEEIRIGDNDNLSALVANLVDADLLVMLTDQAGVFTADPRIDASATLIPEIARIDDDLRRQAGDPSSVGTGGMATKVEAAEMATRSGTRVIIAAGKEPDVLLRLAAGESLGTCILPSVNRVESRKRWILADPPHGQIVADEGAIAALIHRGKSLLAVGVVSASGAFERGQTVRMLAFDGREIGRGITQYNVGDLNAIMGLHSDEIARVLNDEFGPIVVHRDDLVLV